MLAVIEGGARVRRARVVFAGVVLAVALGVLALTAAPAGAKTVWLGFPGHKPDPCTPGLSTTDYSQT
jgi:hypothetical protein